MEKTEKTVTVYFKYPVCEIEIQVPENATEDEIESKAIDELIDQLQSVAKLDMIQD